MMNKYIGHPTQICGVRETRMVGGKADGMRMLEVRNGKGLDFTVSLDRCADIPYLFYKGNSMAYIAPCGLVAPQYYDNRNDGFLKSFTAGFLTTCGLTAVGEPCTDNGEELPLHGNISHIPCESFSYSTDDTYIKITATMRDGSLGGAQFLFEREYLCGLKENTLTITDKITNIGCRETPFMLMYHCNMGYPLLSEKSILTISSVKVEPRDNHAAEDIDTWDKMLVPTDNFVEQCYYHTFDTDPYISLKNPEIGAELEMTFDQSTLDCFTEWKMMGEYEYVLGLEPANCYPDGRNIMREKGILKYLAPSESKTSKIFLRFKDC